MQLCRPRNLYAWLMPTRSSACLRPCTVQSLSLRCLCEWTQNVHCSACRQWTLFHLQMLLPTLQLLKSVRHDHLMLHIVLHVTLMHLCHGELLFSKYECCSTRVPLQNVTDNAKCWHMKCLCIPVYTWCGRKVMRLATLCMNRQCCCLPLHMAVRLTPAVDSVQV